MTPRQKHPSSGSRCKGSMDQRDNAGAVDANSNMSDYFSINRAADKRASQVLTQEIHNEFSNFSGIEYFEGMFRLQVEKSS